MRGWLLLGLAGCGRIGFGAEPVADAEIDAEIDAQIDSPPVDAALQLVETVTVPTLGTPIMSTASLDAGVTYTLIASGTIIMAPPAADPRGDAEYYGFDANLQNVYNNSIDIGLSVNDNSDDAIKLPDWGPYRPDHIYTVSFVGLGAPIELKYHDATYGDNTGTFALAIYR